MKVSIIFLNYNFQNNMLIPVSTVKFSEQSILALRAVKEGPRKVLLVAARSENVTIKDAQTGLLLRTLTGPAMTVYTLLYEQGKVYCGTSSHQVHVYDFSVSFYIFRYYLSNIKLKDVRMFSKSSGFRVIVY